MVDETGGERGLVVVVRQWFCLIIFRGGRCKAAHFIVTTKKKPPRRRGGSFFSRSTIRGRVRAVEPSDSSRGFWQIVFCECVLFFFGSFVFKVYYFFILADGGLHGENTHTHTVANAGKCGRKWRGELLFNPFGALLKPFLRAGTRYKYATACKKKERERERDEINFQL